VEESSVSRTQAFDCGYGYAQEEYAMKRYREKDFSEDFSEVRDDRVWGWGRSRATKSRAVTCHCASEKGNDLHLPLFSLKLFFSWGIHRINFLQHFN